MFKDKNYELWHGDCLEVMDKLIKDGVEVDMILTDPPYGTTACKWDSIIPLDEMWDRINKLLRVNRSCLLFSTQPYTTKLTSSNMDDFKFSAELIQHIPLSLRVRYVFCTAPINKKQPFVCSSLLQVSLYLFDILSCFGLMHFPQTIFC